MGRSQNHLVVGAALLVVTMAGAAAAVRRNSARQRQRQQEHQEGSVSWLAEAGAARFTSGQAGVFDLVDVDRGLSPHIGGAGVLRCSDTGSNVPVDTLEDVPRLVLYAAEIVDGEILLIFFQVSSVSELFRAPFLDRGMRTFAQAGGKVYVARLDAVDGMDRVVAVNQLPPWDQARYSFIWNTGRCGSTLMHKLLQKLGVLSFSEPYWMEQILDLPGKGIDDDTIGRVLGACVAVDVLLARKSFPAHASVSGDASTLGSDHVSFNVKGKGVAMEAVMKAMPDAKHLFMYRDARKVVESFCSIFSKVPTRLDKVIGVLRPLWAWTGLGKHKTVFPKPGMCPPVSIAVNEALKSGALALSPHSRVTVAVFWVEMMCLWKEMVGKGLPKGGCTATLRMDEFVRKDPKIITSVIRFILGEEVEVDDEIIATAVEAFAKHSQAGDLMSRSSHESSSGKARFLTPADLDEIVKITASVPVIGSPDYVFPGSLGLNESK